MVSTPKSTSPSGASLVRIAWLIVAPASPPASTSTAMPVSSVNRAKVSSVTPAANDSCDTTTSFSGAAAVVVGDAACAACRRHQDQAIVVESAPFASPRSQTRRAGCWVHREASYAGITRSRFQRSEAPASLSARYHRAPASRVRVARSEDHSTGGVS